MVGTQNSSDSAFLSFRIFVFRMMKPGNFNRIKYFIIFINHSNFIYNICSGILLGMIDKHIYNISNKYIISLKVC